MEESSKTPTEESSTSQRQSLINEIGRKLREARELRGETVDSPARMLKLSKSNLLALESGNWDVLPDEVYALGFLRQYSKYLQIDINPELELFKNDQYKLTKPLTFLDRIRCDRDAGFALRIDARDRHADAGPRRRDKALCVKAGRPAFDLGDVVEGV